MLSLVLSISLLSVLFLSGCNNSKTPGQPVAQAAVSAKDSLVKNDSIVYSSDSLIIKKIAPHVYQHISWLQTESFGRVECNGMIVAGKNEALVFDTPANDESSAELIRYVSNLLHCNIKAVVATHFHEDCVAGLKTFHDRQIPSYANHLTIEFLKKKEPGSQLPQNGFTDSLELKVGDKKVYAAFYGEGHTKDNVIGYFPGEQVMFGGCLLKENGAGKGNLGDANVKAWPATIKKIKERYPEVKIIIPGHGKTGGAELLDYTMKLFQ